MAKVGYGRAILKAGWRPWGLAIFEVSIVSIVSIIPLLVAALRQVFPANSNIYLGHAFEKSFLGGQLIFYSMGLIATVVWQSNQDLKSFFPYRTIANLYCIIGIVVCTSIVAYDPTLVTVKNSFLGVASIILFSTAILAYVLMVVVDYVQIHVDVGRSLAEKDATLSEEVRQSRGIK